MIFVASIGLVIALGPVVSGAYPRPGQLSLVTVDSNGAQAAHSEQYLFPSLSRDGRYVTFETSRSFSSLDTNTTPDVYVRDVKTGTTELVSVNSSGLQGAPCLPTSQGVVPGSGRAAISGNGRYIAFNSCSNNLVPGDTNLANDYFLHDLRKKTTVAVSVNLEGTPVGAQDPGSASFPTSNYSQTLSSNGRYVIFASEATDIVEDDENDVRDVFVRDMKKASTRRAEGFAGTGNEVSTIISGNGRFLALGVYSTGQTQSTCGDSASASTGCMRVLDLRTARLFSTTAELGFFSTSGWSISHNGRYIAWVSNDPAQIVPNDSNAAPDIFVLDTVTGRRERVNVSSAGEEARESDQGVARGSFIQQGFVTQRPTISPDGRYVSFLSFADNLVENDQNKVYKDAFLHDRETGTTHLLSIGSGCQQNGPYTPGLIDAIHEAREPVTVGRFSVFNTNVSFVADDNDDLSDHDLYLRDIGLPLGAQTSESSSCDVPPSKIVCLTSGTCLPPDGAIRHSDVKGDTIGSSHGTDLVQLRMSYRPHLADLFVALELKDMPHLASRASPIFYGLNFEVGDARYEVRATSLLGGAFVLLDCTDSTTCKKVTHLRGGYGTTGMRIVFSLPLDDVGLPEGGRLSDIQAYSALGHFPKETTKYLDTITLR
ncbi:MAG: hypothetical protein ACRDLB_06900 [Actinomycetota bacterium]